MSTGEEQQCRLNKLIDPLPRIEEALDVLGEAKYFCSFYLTHGFHQIPVEGHDKERMAFGVGTGGLYIFRRYRKKKEECDHVCDELK